MLEAKAAHAVLEEYHPTTNRDIFFLLLRASNREGFHVPRLLGSAMRSESESSRGPSFTKASNLTRMPHLPPKPKEEEAKHLADFFKMMRESKLAEKKRVVSRRSELLKRQEEEERAQVIWEHEILPCWTRAK